MKIFLLLSILIVFSCSAQNDNYSKVLKELDINKQSKLDTGELMLQTEREYTLKLDSLAKVIYSDLSSQKRVNKLVLNVKQKKWESENNVKVKKIWSKLEETNNELGFISNDEKMFAYSEQAQLTHDRILELINKFN